VRPPRIADLGTGSGALLLALLSELPNAFGVGTDLSVAALAVARDKPEGAAAFLRKPFNIDAFCDAVRDHFSRAEAPG